MTIQDLGSLGEMVAAIATVATLVYLELQIRQNAKTVQGSTAQMVINLELSTFALIAQHAGIYQRGCVSIDDLNPEEGVVYQQLVSAVMSLMAAAFIQFQNGLMPDYDTYIADWKNLYLKEPGFQSAWANLRHSYPKDFCRFLDDLDKTAEESA